MEQRRRRHHTRENAFDRLDADTRLVIAERSVGEDQADIFPGVIARDRYFVAERPILVRLLDASSGRVETPAVIAALDFTPVEGSKAGELAAKFDIVMGFTPLA